MTNHPKTLKEALDMFDESWPINTGNPYPHFIETPVATHIRNFLETVWHAGRESVVEKCQETMYESLDEVAQYGKGFVNNDGVKLVNKEDIKVWIHRLTDVITKLSELKK